MWAGPGGGRAILGAGYLGKVPGSPKLLGGLSNKNVGDLEK